jgi:hypothetical protein
MHHVQLLSIAYRTEQVTKLKKHDGPIDMKTTVIRAVMTMMSRRRRTHRLLFMLLLSLNAARAHKHNGTLSEEEANAPIDSILWIHIFLQAAVWGVLFPIGMVLGLSRSRWHVPLQVRPRSPRLSPPPLHSTYSYRPLFFFLRYPAPYLGSRW